MNTVTLETRKSSKDIINRLRDEAVKSPSFSAICHVFAMRERTRQQVTMHNLQASMIKEGFSNFSRVDYEKALVFMASLGLGQLDYDHKGRLRALKGIKVTLQSIGLAAVSKKDTLEKFTPAPSFTSLLPQNAAKVVDIAPQKPQETWPATLTVMIEGKPVVFDLPGMDAKELGLFLAKTFAKRQP